MCATMLKKEKKEVEEELEQLRLTEVAQSGT